MAEYALRLENAADTAARVRMADALGLAQGGSLTARSGVKNDGGGAVTVNAGTMQVQVSPLIAWVDGGSSTSQGGYPFVLDAAKTLTLSDGHATLARVDTIAVVIHEDTYDGSGLTDAAVVVVTGTPGAGAPSLPATALPLRNVNVPAGLSTGTGGLSSGNLSTDRRTYLAAAGGIIRVASQTERDALANLQPGTTVYRSDLGEVETYNGTDWGKHVQSAAVTAATGTGTSWSKAVTFARPFKAGTTPQVTVTGTANAPIVWNVTAVTNTGFTAYAEWNDSSSHSSSGAFNYIAHGQRA